MGEFPQGESTAGTQEGAETAGSEGEPGIEDGGESAPGDMGEFPQGESTAGTQDGAETAGGEGEPGMEDSSGSEAEPGFGDGDYAAGEDDALPDLRDEPTLEEAMESFEEAMGEAAGDSAAGGSAAGDPTTAGSSSGSAAQDGASGTPEYSGTDTSGKQGDKSSGAGTGGSGTLTPAEQVAILGGRLERGTGEFDAMILDEQAAQRRAAREQEPGSATEPGSTDSEPGGGYEGDIADAGVYSPGGGIGGVSRPGESAGIPRNTAKYPPPAGIPSGSDDDVFARQLREAAMREPDPAVREKLWDEYRKYKGID